MNMEMFIHMLLNNTNFILTLRWMS